MIRENSNGNLARFNRGFRVILSESIFRSLPMPVRRHPVAVNKEDLRFTRLPLDLALVSRLKSSYARLREQDNRLAEKFYHRLFMVAPKLRPMFRGDLGVQSQKLMSALDAVVRNLERPDDNAALIAEMGKRHAGYGVKPEHYDLVIDLLVEPMKELLELDSNCEGPDEWRTALRLISDQMINAAKNNVADAHLPASS